MWLMRNIRIFYCGSTFLLLNQEIIEQILEKY